MAIYLLKQPKVEAVQFTGSEMFEFLMTEMFASVAQDSEGVHIETVNGDVVLTEGDWVVKALHPLLAVNTWAVVPDAEFLDLFDADES